MDMSSAESVVQILSVACVMHDGHDGDSFLLPLVLTPKESQQLADVTGFSCVRPPILSSGGERQRGTILHLPQGEAQNSMRKLTLFARRSALAASKFSISSAEVQPSGLGFQSGAEPMAKACGLNS